MLQVKTKQPEEVLMEKKLRSPFETFPIGHTSHKYDFFKNRVKEFINYHLDYAKYNKKIISEEAFEGLKKLEKEEALPKRKQVKTEKKTENNCEFKGIRDGLLAKVSTLEKISGLIKSAQRVYENLEKAESKEIVLSRISNSRQIYSTIQDIIDKELDCFHISLSQFDTYNQKQVFELAGAKKEMLLQHQSEIDSLKSKFDMKLKALTQHNKALSSNKNESKLNELFKEKIENLEGLNAETSAIIAEKSEHLRQKTSEISYLKQYINEQNEEISSLHKKIADLEALVTVQQDSYHGQIYDLTSEIARIKNLSQDNLLTQQMENSQFKYVAESATNRLDQVLSELHQCEDHLNYVTSQAKEREKFLSEENLDLRAEIERLDRIVITLKEELDQVPSAVEVESLRLSSRQKDEERDYLNEIIGKLDKESTQILNRNKELLAYNLQLEEQISKSKDSRSLKSSKSEKKMKKK